MQKFWRYKRFILISTFAVATLVTAGSGYLFQTNRAITNTQASSPCNCTDSNVCYPDGCSRKPKTADNTFDEARYDSVCKQFDPGYRIPDSLLSHYCSVQQPDCCFDVYKYHDSRLCCWQERYSCHPSLCAGSSGGASCGKYWSVPSGWSAYGCVKKEGNNTVPLFGPLPPNLPLNSQPTNTPIPQATNTQAPIPPTSTPRPQATNTPIPPIPTNTTRPGQPTNTPLPTQPRAPTSTPLPPAATSTPRPPQPTAPLGQPTYTPYPTNPYYTPSPTPLPENIDENDILRADGNNENKYGFSLPQMPHIEVKSPKELAREVVTFERVQTLEEATAKPMKSVTTTYKTVKEYDQQLEVSVESFIERIKRQILEFISSL